jgi:hypothetical protein
LRMLQQLVAPRQGGSSTGRLLLRRQGGSRLQLETLCSDNREDHFQLETSFPVLWLVLVAPRQGGSSIGRLVLRQQGGLRLQLETFAPTTGRLAPPWRLSQCYGWPWVLQQQGGFCSDNREVFTPWRLSNGLRPTTCLPRTPARCICGWNASMAGFHVALMAVLSAPRHDATSIQHPQMSVCSTLLCWTIFQRSAAIDCQSVLRRLMTSDSSPDAVQDHPQVKLVVRYHLMTYS